MSSSSKSLTVVIPFDGTTASFGVWRKRIRAAFKVRGWDKYVNATATTTGDSSSLDDSKDDQKQMDAAYGSLIESLPFDLIAAYTSDDPTLEHPTVLWNSIVAHFESTSMANRAHLRNKLASTRMSSTYLVFYTEVMTTVNTLKSMGEQVTDAEVMYQILKGLTPTFDMIKLVLQHDKAITVEGMHRALSVRAEQMALDDSARVEETYYGGRMTKKGGANTSRPRDGPDCWTCDQPGHRAFDCPQNHQKVKCNFCRAIGSHTEDKCRKKHAAIGTNNNNSSNNSSNNNNSFSKNNQVRSGKFVKFTTPGPSSTSGRYQNAAQHYNQQEHDTDEENFFFGVCDEQQMARSSAIIQKQSRSSSNSLAAYNYTLTASKFKSINALAVPQSTHAIIKPKLIPSSSTEVPQTIELVLDSAASISTCNNQSLLVDLKAVKPIHVKVASGQTVTLDRIGSLRVSVDEQGSKIITITKVYYSPDCPVNLLSVGATTKLGKEVTFHRDGASIRRSDGDRATILVIPAVGNLFIVKLHVHTEKNMEQTAMPQIVNDASSNQSDESMKLYRLWHSRLGHLGKNQLEKLVKSTSMSGLDQLLDFDFTVVDRSLCDGCELGKACRKSFSRFKQGELASEILDRFHADIKGPVNQPALRGERYVLTVTDEKSRRSFLFLLKKKSDAADRIIHLCKRTQVETGKTLREFHSDNGTEFVNKELQSFFAHQGTRFTTTTPGTPQHNGIAERLNRTIFDKMRAMMFHAQLPPYFWGLAVIAAGHIKNKTLTSINGGLTPDTIWRQQTHALNQRGRSSESVDSTEFKTSLKNMRVFGCNVYYHLQHQQPTQPRSAKGIFLGYDDEARGYYRIIDLQSRKLITRRDVHFDENNFSFVREYTQDRFRPVEIQEDVKPNNAVSSNIKSDMGGGSDSAVVQAEVQRVPADAPSDTSNSSPEPDSEPDDDPEEKNKREPRPAPSAARLSVAAPAPSLIKAARPKTVFDAVRAENVLLSPRVRKPKVVNLLASVVSDSSPVIKAKSKTNNEVEEEYDDPEPHFTPNTFKQAMQCKNSDHWLQAARGEIEAMQLTRSYELVPRPPGANIIDSRWVWTKKLALHHGRIKRFRARLTARGFKQVKDLDYFETFAPVMRYKSWKILCAIAGTLDYEMRHLDVPKAFLNADLKEIIYMEQPEGFHNGDNTEVWMLRKSVYGIKQAPNNWNEDLNKFLLSLGFTRCVTDTCIYTKQSRTGRLLALGIFVDDVIPIFSRVDQLEWDDTHRALKDKYDIKDTGDASVVLGMRVTRDRTHRTIKLDQASYIAKLLDEFQLSDCNTASTPSGSYILSKADCPQTIEEGHQVDRQRYQQMVGSLNYAAISTRPDIQFAVGVLSRYLQNPGHAHMTACKRVFRYLKGTADLGLILGGTESIDSVVQLTAYSDSDWGGSHDDRRSTTGYVIMVSGSVVSWLSKRQAAVALSSCEAEYYAISAAVAEIQWIRQFISEVLAHDSELQHSRVVTVGLVDNQSAMAVSKNDIHHNRTKHIDIRHHFVRDAITAGTITLEYVPTQDQLADILTKGLGRVAFERLRDQLMA
jgi:transposase InsO family protein